MNINVIKKIKIGSSVFFEKFPDYKQKDIDELNITDCSLFGKHIMNLKRDTNDMFFMALEDKDVIIEKTLESNVPMRVGKFLVPEFCELIDFKTEDFEKLKPLFDKLDEKHRYEIIIRDSYIQNNSFTLTEKQRKKAYSEYKRERNML